jgi:hypothetical protein
VPADRRPKNKRSNEAGSNSRASKDRYEHQPPDSAVGWEAYRGWLNKLDRSGARRQGPDSIYTWKGYKAWTARVRADWDQDT